MRIAQIDIYAHQLSYAGGTFAMSRERTVAIESSTLVRVSTDEGITGCRARPAASRAPVCPPSQAVSEPRWPCWPRR